MKARYYGKKIERNEFGDVVAKFDRCVEVDYTEAEAENMEAWLESTGFRFDLFGSGDGSLFALVYVSDKEDAGYFLGLWKEAKPAIREGAFAR